MLRVNSVIRSLAFVATVIMSQSGGSLPATEKPTCGGICVHLCPTFPDQFCRSYGCSGNGAACMTSTCGPYNYGVYCPQP